MENQKPELERIKLSEFAADYITYAGCPEYIRKIDQINELIKFMRDNGYQIFKEKVIEQVD